MYLTTKLFFAAIGCSIFFPGFAQTAYNKNGWPCVKELCIGDGIDELKKVALTPTALFQYSKSASARKIEESMDRAVADLDTGGLQGPTDAVKKVRHYQGSFDSALLDTLRLVYSCHSEDFLGSYKTESGLVTKVNITLVPLKDGQAQKWIVTSIYRSWPDSLSSDQKVEFLQKLNDTYAEFNKPDTIKTTPTHVDIFDIPSLTLAWDRSGRHPYTLEKMTARDMYLKYPACIPKMHSID